MLTTSANENASHKAIGDAVVSSGAGGIKTKNDPAWKDTVKADLIHAIKGKRMNGADKPVETQELTALEDQFRMVSRIFENANEGIMILDASGSVRYVNPALCAATGYSVGELVGKTPFILKPGGQKEEFCAGVWESLGGTGKWRGKIWGKRKNGDIYPTWFSISSVMDSTGKVSQYMGISMDMSSLSGNGELPGMSSAMTGLMLF